jgi:hypothetical protein
LTFNFSLNKFLDYRDRIECTVDIDILERVCLEDDSNAFLFRNNEDNIGVEFEVGESEKHGDDERLFGSKHASGAGHKMDVWLFVVKRISLGERKQNSDGHVENNYLDFGTKNKVCIPGISEAKNASELIHSQFTDIANLQIRGLAELFDESTS